MPTAIEAMNTCSNVDAKLVEPQTRLHQIFLNSLLRIQKVVGYIWTGYRRNVHNLTEANDVVFSTATGKITEMFGGTLDY